MFRFRWLHNFIRRHTSPIPEDSAAIWKRRLAFGYAFLAWNAFGFVCYAIMHDKADWALYHGIKSKEDTESSAHQWAKTLGAKNPKIYRINGLQVTDITDQNTDQNKVENKDKM